MILVKLEDRIRVAYKKLKPQVYFERHPLPLRRRLAEFECGKHFEKRTLRGTKQSRRLKSKWSEDQDHALNDQCKRLKRDNSKRRQMKLFPSKRSNSSSKVYSTVTGVPTGVFSKNILAIESGILTQP